MFLLSFSTVSIVEFEQVNGSWAIFIEVLVIKAKKAWTFKILISWNMLSKKPLVINVIAILMSTLLASIYLFKVAMETPEERVKSI